MKGFNIMTNDMMLGQIWDTSFHDKCPKASNLAP